MSAFEGTFLNVALRDLGMSSFAICGIATEVRIEPTVRHGADLGYIPLVIGDAISCCCKVLAGAVVATVWLEAKPAEN